MSLTGQVGYAVNGMQSTKEARVDDTIYHSRSPDEPLPGIAIIFHLASSNIDLLTFLLETAKLLVIYYSFMMVVKPMHVGNSFCALLHRIS